MKMSFPRTLAASKLGDNPDRGSIRKSVQNGISMAESALALRIVPYKPHPRFRVQLLTLLSIALIDWTNPG
jgi:hypothetical protein